MQKWGRMPENLKWAGQKQEAYIHPEGLKNSVREAQVKCLTQIENGSPNLPPAQLNEKVKEAITRRVRKPRKTWHTKRKQETKTTKLKERLVKDAQSLSENFTWRSTQNQSSQRWRGPTTIAESFLVAPWAAAAEEPRKQGAW